MRTDSCKAHDLDDFELSQRQLQKVVHRDFQTEKEAFRNQLSTKTGRVPHRKRPTVEKSLAAHVTWKLVDGLRNLRFPEMMRVLERCFRAGKERFGFKLATYTVLSNHVHLIVTAPNDKALRAGLQGLGIRMARAINRVLGRRGKVFGDRFFSRPLVDHRSVKWAVRYALLNARKHQVPLPKGAWDPYSSARFNKRVTDEPRGSWPVASEYINAMHPIGLALRFIGPDEVPGRHRFAYSN